MQTTGDSWSLVNGDGVYTSFGKYGEVIRTDTYKNGEMHITVIFTYSYGSGKPICNSKEERNLVTKVSIITTFTDDGEVETIVYYKDGSIASEQKFNYENNILISIESLTAGSVEKKTYEYDSSNKLKVENLFKGGMLVSRIEYGDNDGEFIEELFTDGVLFARIYYVEGKKVKEEIIVDGTVVRTRAF
jgi:antitoxin component YwqK of YwqJK toxin-antitoxin module